MLTYWCQKLKKNGKQWASKQAKRCLYCISTKASIYINNDNQQWKMKALSVACMLTHNKLAKTQHQTSRVLIIKIWTLKVLLRKLEVCFSDILFVCFFICLFIVLLQFHAGQGRSVSIQFWGKNCRFGSLRFGSLTSTKTSADVQW